MTASGSMRAIDGLPVSRTRLIGRARDLATVRALLLHEAVPLLTLSGPGRPGKTRSSVPMAQDVADDFVHGVDISVPVPLAPTCPIC